MISSLKSNLLCHSERNAVSEESKFLMRFFLRQNNSEHKIIIVSTFFL